MSLSTMTVEEKRQTLYEIEALEYAKAERNLAFYFREAWKILEPVRQFLHNWHHDLIAEYLVACYRRQIKRLIINIPPRYTKSNLVTVAYPTWCWTKRPEERFVTTSYSSSLSTKHSVDRRTLVESAWYQRGWGMNFQLSTDQNMKTEFQNNRRGHMTATSMHGTATGKGGDQIIVDDPHDAMKAGSDTIRQSDIEAFDQKFTSRLDDKENGVIILVMQRLHERDLTGHLLDQAGWTHLCLPATAVESSRIVFPISGKVVERREGDILHPRREDKAQLESAKESLGSMAYQSQYQQDPRPQEGGFFKREHWRRFRELPMERLKTVQFWDCAEKPGISNDYSVCMTWVQTLSGFYAIDRFRERVAFPELERACLDQYNQHKPHAVVIEDKSAGTQLIQNLKAKTTLPILPYQPGVNSKEVRAGGAVPTQEAGNLYLPDQAAWAEEFILEHERFPNVEHDDQVDTTSMMVEHFKQGQAPRIRRL